MKTVFITSFLCLMFLTFFRDDATQVTASKCPVKLPSDIRRPPGIPGKPGSKGKDNRQYKELYETVKI